MSENDYHLITCKGSSEGLRFLKEFNAAFISIKNNGPSRGFAPNMAGSSPQKTTRSTRYPHVFRASVNMSEQFGLPVPTPHQNGRFESKNTPIANNKRIEYIFIDAKRLLSINTISIFRALLQGE